MFQRKRERAQSWMTTRYLFGCFHYIVKVVFTENMCNVGTQNWTEKTKYLSLIDNSDESAQPLVRYAEWFGVFEDDSRSKDTHSFLIQITILQTISTRAPCSIRPYALNFVVRCTNLPLTQTATVFRSSPLYTHFSIFSGQLSHPNKSTGPSSKTASALPTSSTEPRLIICASHSLPTSKPPTLSSRPTTVAPPRVARYNASSVESFAASEV